MERVGMYNIGDRVTIRSDLKPDGECLYGQYDPEGKVCRVPIPVMVNSDMMQYKGREAKIIDYVAPGYYILDIENDLWVWTDEMFEGKSMSTIFREGE